MVMGTVTHISAYRYRGVTVRTYTLHDLYFAHYRTYKHEQSKIVSSATWLGVRLVAEREIHGELTGPRVYRPT